MPSASLRSLSIAYFILQPLVYGWSSGAPRFAHNRHYGGSSQAMMGSSSCSSFLVGETSFSRLDDVLSRDSKASSTTSLIYTLYMGLRGKKVRRRKREARELLRTPALIDTPYGPIRMARPPTVCDSCRGRGVCRCSVCQGRGVVRASGLQKRNQLPRKLEGSQWTSVEVYRGHRHHTIMEVRGSPRCMDTYQVRMRNCCGPTSDFWIPVHEIREKRVWRMGWLTLQDIRKADGGPIIDARLCFRCKGGKVLACVECDGKGEIPSYEPMYDL